MCVCVCVLCITKFRYIGRLSHLREIGRTSRSNCLTRKEEATFRILDLVHIECFHLFSWVSHFFGHSYCFILH